MTTGEVLQKLWRWMGTRTCARAGHKWYPENGPPPNECPECVAGTQVGDKVNDPSKTIRDMRTGELRCGRPPAGWDCTREPNHEGPCAALPDPRVSERPTLIESPTYTVYKDCFGLYKEQNEIIHKWMKEHDQARHIDPKKGYRYSGAIGGAYTFQFTPTSLGTVVRVKCSCGERIDVTDYDNW